MNPNLRNPNADEKRPRPHVTLLAELPIPVLQHQTPLGWSLRYGFALVAIAAAFVFRVAVTTWIGPGLPTYVTFYPAVMVAALIGGFGPGLLATALSGLAASFWLLPPIGHFALASPAERVGLLIFTAMGLFMSGVAELYRRNRGKAAAYDRQMALSEARREKEFLARILERSSQPFGVGYPDGRLGMVNRAFEQLTGYTAPELRATDWANTLTPTEWRELEGKKLEELQRTGQPVRYEKEYLRKDGTRVPIELLVHLATDSSGKPEYYFSFLTDITERKRTEKALRESRERLDLALLSSRMATFDWDIVNNKRSWSHGVHSLLGTRPETFTGTAEEFLQVIHPEDRSTVQAALARALETGVYETEYRAVWPDRTIRHIAARGKIHRDHAGQPVQMTGVCWDITDRKQAQEALRDSEVRYRTLFNTIDAGFCIIQMVFDAAGKPVDYRFLETNAAFERQTGLHDAQGKLMRDLVPAHEAHWFEIYGQIALTGEARHFVNEAKQLHRWYDVYAYRVGTPESRQVAILFNDVTAHKRAEEEIRRRAEELKAANDELTRFNRVTIGREMRIIDLKKQVNKLSEALGQPAPYRVELEDETKTARVSE